MLSSRFYYEVIVQPKMHVAVMADDNVAVPKWASIAHGGLASFYCTYSSSCMPFMSHNWSVISHETVSSSTECSRDKPPFSFVRGQDSTMWDIVWVSPRGHGSVSVSCHFLLQAPHYCANQWPHWMPISQLCNVHSAVQCCVAGWLWTFFASC